VSIALVVVSDVDNELLRSRRAVIAMLVDLTVTVDAMTVVDVFIVVVIGGVIGIVFDFVVVDIVVVTRIDPVKFDTVNITAIVPAVFVCVVNVDDCGNNVQFKADGVHEHNAEQLDISYHRRST
jgi:hypothetical protein